jgi:hypothetical protein
LYGDSGGEVAGIDGGTASIKDSLVQNGCPVAATCSGTLLSSNPLLGVLLNNGGWTQTRAIPAGSPAIDRGGADCVTLDQRGLARVDGDNSTTIECDMGAFEFTPLHITGTTGSVAGVDLAYFDGSTKHVLSTGGGSYDITVPYFWTGTVTPSKLGYIFTPDHRDYVTPLTANLPGQNYTVTLTTAVVSTYPLDTGDMCETSPIAVEFLLADIAPSAQTFLLDGFDVTSSTQEWALGLDPSRGTIVYTPPGPLSVGPHQAEFDYELVEGFRSEIWNFNVTGPCLMDSPGLPDERWLIPFGTPRPKVDPGAPVEP